MYLSKIKFGAVTNLTDARYAAAMFADWIGFCFDEAEARYIEPAKAKVIIDWVAGPEMVAEISQKTPQQMKPALELLGIHTVQCPFASYREWKDAGFKVIVVCHNLDQAEKAKEEIVLIRGEQRKAQNIDRQIIDVTNLDLPFIKVLAEKKPFAINITGGDETAPGMRDFAEMDDILELFQ